MILENLEFIYRVLDIVRWQGGFYSSPNWDNTGYTREECNKKIVHCCRCKRKFEIENFIGEVRR